MSEKRRTINVADEEIQIDLREILRILQKWSKLIISMTLLLALAVGLLSYFVLPPIYEAKTLVMVTQATEKLQTASTQQKDQGLEGVVDSVSRIPVWTMNTYLGQLKSEALMKRIIARLSLPPSYTSTSLAEMIEATVVKDTNLIDITVTNQDPELAAAIANTLCSEYLSFMTEKNQEQMSRSVSFLDEQGKANEQELVKATEVLRQFQSQPRSVPVLEAEFKAKGEDRVTYNSRLMSVQVEVNQLAEGVRVLEQELATTPQTVSSTSKGSYSGNGYTSTQEVNPLYVSLSQSLAEKRSQLAEKQSESSTLQTILGALNTEIDGLQAELASKKLEQDKLQREVERLQKTSTTLADKKTETQIARSMDLGDTSVVVMSEASLPVDPIKPNKKLNIAIATVLGLVFFTLLAFILEYLDNTLKTPEDIARELELPVLGVIPRMTKSNRAQVAYGGKSK